MEVQHRVAQVCLHCSGVEAGGEEGHELNQIGVGRGDGASDEHLWQC
jgi:hypothetical protein